MNVSLLERAIAFAPNAAVHQPRGVIVNILGLVVEVAGLRAAVGDTLEVISGTRRLTLEVVGFRASRLLTTPFGSVSGIRAGMSVVHLGHGATIRVGDDLLGRVIDPFGEPMDAMGPPLTTQQRAVHDAPPDPFRRRPIEEVFETRIRAIDGLLTLGVGQRVGIFAGAGVGKSTLLGMMCRSARADVNVLALVGERGRELLDFVRHALGPEGLARSVVVAATSDRSPLVRARGAEAATAIAEHFRDQGKRVLLVMDSLTRYAMALRETALAAGEPPATKGYPPSVFAALPRLLERAGTTDGPGSITAVYTVLVEGDDLSDPVADAVRGILDGHIVLTRQLAERGHFPAIDVLQSVSRVATAVAPDSQLAHASAMRSLMASYRDAQELIQIGAYVPGSDKAVDAAKRALPQIDAFLKQGSHETTAAVETAARLQVIAGVRS